MDLWRSQLAFWEQQFKDDEIRKEAEALRAMDDEDLFRWAVSFDPSRYRDPDDEQSDDGDDDERLG